MMLNSRSITGDDDSKTLDSTAKYLKQRLGKGFDFSFANRNSLLMSKGMRAPTATKTGTTICGLIFKDGVILGADTRATAGPIVAQKNCEKIHYLSDNIYCCGAGTAADTEQVTEMISSQLRLMRLNMGGNNKSSRVIMALTKLKRYLFRYMGYVSAALVLGGVDINGPHLHTVWPQGSTTTLPYVTMGSGSLAAMAIFESRFKKNMNKQDATKLVIDAIKSGISNDLGSGSNVDLCIMTKDKTEFKRNIFKTEKPAPKQLNYKYQKGTTIILDKKIIKFDNNDIGYNIEKYNHLDKDDDVDMNDGSNK